MWHNILYYCATLAMAGVPLTAAAQTQPASPDYWYGPWFMWGGGWASWWWICPLMMIAMIAVMMLGCRFMCGWHRD
jgi:uncharacterized membrane protein